MSRPERLVKTALSSALVGALIVSAFIHAEAPIHTEAPIRAQGSLLPLMKSDSEQTKAPLSALYPILDLPSPVLPLPPYRQSTQPIEQSLRLPRAKPVQTLKKTKDEKGAFNEMDALPPQPLIAIVIDDVGYNRRGMEQTLALPLEVALAILPKTPFGKKTAIKAQEQKRITLLHAPMENERELKLGPGGLYAKMSESEFKKVLRDDIADLPGITGVNNHMGSLLTAKPQPMKWVMSVLKEQQLFFVDSLTNPNSVAAKTAQEFGLPNATRQVFLDNIRTQQQIDRQFQRLLQFAHRSGIALAIGHPYPETTDYLNQRLRQSSSARLVPLSALLSVEN